ncbi:MAG: hypothetical protein ACRD26_05510, partial [Vicinamibacterales bacterium]
AEGGLRGDATGRNKPVMINPPMIECGLLLPVVSPRRVGRVAADRRTALRGLRDLRGQVPTSPVLSLNLRLHHHLK